MKKKLLAMLLCMSMVMTMLPMSVFAVSDKANVGTNANTATAMEIVYGGQNWRVIGYDGTGVASTSGNMTLFAKDNIGTTPFHPTSTSNVYANSTLKTAVEDIYAAFDSREKTAVVPRTLATGAYSETAPWCDGVATTEVASVNLWPLSTAEVKLVNFTLRTSAAYWWLRSPGCSAFEAAIVYSDGYVDSPGFVVNYSGGVRPAFRLNLSSVLFTSAAVGGKSGTADATLAAIGIPSGAQKLTMIDNNLSNGTITVTGANSNAGTAVQVNVASATESKSVSAIITDSAGVVTFYGKIGVTDGSGNASNLNLTLPVTLGAENVLKIFVETINGDNITDYASTPVEVTVTAALSDAKVITAFSFAGLSPAVTGTITGTDIALTVPNATDVTALVATFTNSAASVVKVNATAQTSGTTANNFTSPVAYLVTAEDGTTANYTVTVTVAAPLISGSVTMPWGQSFMVNNKKADDATVADRTTVIKYNNKDWYVIGAQGTGVASETGTMTLFAKNNIGTTLFHATSNVYANSTLKTTVEDIYAAFDSGEKTAVVPRMLATGVYSGTAPWCDGVATTEVAIANLWPLSTAEVNSVYSTLRTSSAYWWLRSPGFLADYAAIVRADGYVYSDGLSVYDSYGIRPAFKLNLSSVLFTSAATGGKSGTAATTLAAVGAPSGAQKLTIIDTTNLALSTATTTDTLTANSNITVNYAGATTGKPLSAIVKDSTGAVKYYGKLIENIAATVGSVSVTIPSDFTTGWIIEVFVEQINADGLTDYASTAVPVTVDTAADLASVATVKGLVAGATYTMTQAAATNEAAVKTEIEIKIATLALDGVAVPVTKVLYTAAVAGDAGTPAGTNGNYTFTVALSKGAASDTTATLTMTITATAYASSSNGSSSSGSSNNGSTVINTNNGSVTGTQLNNAAEIAQNWGTVTINANKNSQVTFPAFGLGSLSKNNNSLTIVTDNGTLTFDSKAVNSIGSEATAENIKVIVKKIVDKTKLTQEQQSKVGERDVYDLTVTSGGKLISNFNGGKVNVSIPYELKSGEKAENVTVWYMADDVSLAEIQSTYDVITKSVTFMVNHFSKYIIGYNALADWVNPFIDVKSSAWYYNAVAFANQNGLMKGQSTTLFDGESLMTRGMFVTILGRMEGINKTTYENQKTFSDVMSNQYYAPYITWASDKGIVNGVGNEKYAPDQAITREQMAVMMTNYMKFKGQGPVGAWAIQLTYGDLDKVSTWASEGVMFMTMKGLMNGMGNDSNGKPVFAPDLNSTRAQTAQVIMRLGELLK